MDKMQEQIAKRAYELFEARGGQHGYHIQDWFQAEKDVLKKSGASVNKPSIKTSDIKTKSTKTPLQKKAKATA